MMSLKKKGHYVMERYLQHFDDDTFLLVVFVNFLFNSVPGRNLGLQKLTEIIDLVVLGLLLEESESLVLLL